MPKLKPCPFCGRSVPFSAEAAEIPTFWQIICNQCGAATGYRGSEADAIRDWNTRPLEDAQQRIISAYNDELDRVLDGHKAAIDCLHKWDPALAQDFVALLILNMEIPEETPTPPPSPRTSVFNPLFSLISHCKKGN